MQNPVILIDGSSYLYRAYYAFPSLTNSSGEPTGAIYGVLNMLKSLLLKYKTNNFGVVFDANGKTFRDDLFESYKANRKPMPEQLSVQVQPLQDMIQTMGLPLIIIKDVEADDVIGTIAKEAANNGRDVLISTSDKDMAQLVSTKINLINTASNTILDPEKVKLKFGITPELIIDYLALTGDRSDNIPGVPGIGKTIATILLQKIGGIQNVYKNIDIISEMNFRGARTVASKLIKNKQLAFLSHQLATIKTNIPLNLPYSQLTATKKPDNTNLMLMFQHYELKNWINDLKSGKWLCERNNNNTIVSSIKKTNTTIINQKETTIKTISNNKYIIIDSMHTLRECIQEVYKTGIFIFDITTDLPDAITANIAEICFACNPTKAAYIPVGHNYSDKKNQLNIIEILTTLKPILENHSINKIGQNIKFNIGILKRYNIELSGLIFDVKLESYVLNNISSNHNIDSLAKRFLHYSIMSFEQLFEQKNKKLAFSQITINHAANHSAEKINITLQLHENMWPQIQASSGLQKVFKEIEMPLISVLSRIEQTGVLVDNSVLSRYSMELAKNLEELEDQAHQLAKEPFNLSSTNQIKEILYNKHKLPILQKTTKGSPSTNEQVLSKLAIKYSLPRLILKYRSLYKLKHTYTDKLPQMINSVSKRIHTSYHQTITATGRLSSSNPNLQNIPIRNYEGRRIRQAFVAPPQKLIVATDYSQIELRIMAHLAEDAGLIKAFNIEKDIHRTTASEVFNIPAEQVTEHQRRSAKTINFGLIYGMSAFGLARQLDISQSKAQQYINLYFEKYPGILKYMDNIRRQANDKGYVKTIYGRRIYLPDIYSSNGTRKKSAERAAINGPIQGTAADIIKQAMIAIDSWLQKEKPQVKMIMQVHDELVFEVNLDFIEKAKNKIRSLMEGCFKLNVPIKVDIGIGENWDQAH